jgi:hypothetical protein
MQAYSRIKEIEEGFQLCCQLANPESGGVYQEDLPGEQSLLITHQMWQ